MVETIFRRTGDERSGQSPPRPAISAAIAGPARPRPVGACSTDRPADRCDVRESSDVPAIGCWSVDRPDRTAERGFDVADKPQRRVSAERLAWTVQQL